MKKMTTIGNAALTLGLATAIAAGMTLRQDADFPGMDDNTVAMVQGLKKAHDNPTVPSEFHKKLDHFVGEWDVTVRVWAMGPGTPPIESKGTASVGWMLGERFAIEELDAELDMGGMKIPLESVTITGYDNYRNQYVGTMFSAMSTEVINYQGGVSPDGKTFSYYGTMHEPMLNIAGRMIRISTTITGENTHTVAVYDLHAGQDYKVLEFVYVRK